VSRKKYFFDEVADRLIAECYDSSTETIDRLSQTLALPRWAVKKRAQALGLSRTKEKPWSQKEMAYLETNLHRLSLAVLARKLNRTVTAVALKAKRLGIKKSEEGYTARSLAQAFGVDDHKVVRWVQRGILKASRRNSGRPHDLYFISDQEEVWFIDVLAGVRR